MVEFTIPKRDTLESGRFDDVDDAQIPFRLLSMASMRSGSRRRARPHHLYEALWRDDLPAYAQLAIGSRRESVCRRWSGHDGKVFYVRVERRAKHRVKNSRNRETHTRVLIGLNNARQHTAHALSGGLSTRLPALQDSQDEVFEIVVAGRSGWEYSSDCCGVRAVNVIGKNSIWKFSHLPASKIFDEVKKDTLFPDTVSVYLGRMWKLLKKATESVLFYF
ncbi:hypothetical protein CPC08DRAFT_727638 [Agrocybe pediades]|nr:hypothetical protein CPC08DRAFT_727638 [Agrocybe pediades]